MSRQALKHKPGLDLVWSEWFGLQLHDEIPQMRAASIIDLPWKQPALLCGLCAGSLYGLFNGDGASTHDEKTTVTLGTENKRSSNLVYWIKSLLLLVMRDIYP
jgi:hypothetical protein